MDCLNSYIEARRIAGTHDTEAPPTIPNASPFPLEEPGESEPTIVTHGGTPAESDDPCSIAVADDPQLMTIANWGHSC